MSIFVYAWSYLRYHKLLMFFVATWCLGNILIPHCCFVAASGSSLRLCVEDSTGFFIVYAASPTTGWSRFSLHGLVPRNTRHYPMVNDKFQRVNKILIVPSKQQWNYDVFECGLVLEKYFWTNMDKHNLVFVSVLWAINRYYACFSEIQCNHLYIWGYLNHYFWSFSQEPEKNVSSTV